MTAGADLRVYDAASVSFAGGVMGWSHFIGRAAVLRAAGCALSLIGFLLVPLPLMRAVEAQSVPAIRFRIRFFAEGNTPAGPGLTLSVVNARTVTDVFVCGSGVTGSDGRLSIDVQPVARCTDEGNGGGPVQFLFVSNGEQVGTYSTHLLLSRPQDLGHEVQLAVASNAPSAPPTNVLLVPLRFSGTVMIGAGVAPAGTRVNVSAARGPAGLVSCGNGVVNGSGQYTIDLASDPRCTDDGNGGGPVEYVFTIDGTNVGSYEAHVRLDMGSSLGHVVIIRLVGRPSR